MTSGWFVTANDIKHWTEKNKRQAEEKLPELISQLIRASVKADVISNLSFPYGDGINTSGYDGIVEVNEGNEFVPSGISGWEVGTRKDVNNKANKDYKERIKNPIPLNPLSTTFVIVTSRHWQDKDKWCKEKAKERKWKDVKGINANSLQDWLRQCPEVHRWFAMLIGKRVEGIWDIMQAWEAWRHVTSVPLHSDLVINGREDQSKKLLSSLRNTPEIIRIKASSEKEAYGFILATLRDQEEFACRVLIVKNQAQWDGLLDNRNALILVPDKFSPSNLGYTKQKGHSVVIPASLYEPSYPQEIQLKKMSRENRIHALQSMGLIEEHARKVYSDTRGYFDPICRHPLLEPSDNLSPEWLDHSDADILVSVLLATVWDTENEYDQDAVSRIAGISYEQFEEKIERFRSTKDPPIRFVGNICQIVSKIDLWYLVRHKLSKRIIKQLKPVIFEVLGELDPSYDLPPEERWLASIKGVTPKYSEFLKSGLADTLALLAGWGHEAYPSLGSTSLAEYVTCRIRELLTNDLSAKNWYSFGRHVISFAEADPEQFLRILETHLQNDTSPILDCIMYNDGAYTHLLWALHTISWNIDYLPAVTHLLARLEEINPQKAALGALWSIYVGWAPHTSATYQQRLNIVDASLMKRHPEVAWKLLLALVPRYGQGAFPISHPTYRDWAAHVSTDIDKHDCAHYIEEIIERIFRLYTEQPDSKWLELLEEVSDLPEKYLNRFLSLPCPFVPEQLRDEERRSLSTKLRELIYEHRIYAKALWAWPKDLVDKLEEAFTLITPQDIVSQHRYLFDDYHPHFIHPGENYTEIEYINKHRIQALHEIYQQQEIEGIQQLVESCRFPRIVGSIAAMSEVQHNVEQEFLSWLDGHSDVLLEAAKAFVTVTASRIEEWAKMTLDCNRSWGRRKIINFLIALPFEQGTFEIVHAHDGDIQESYWKNVSYAIHEETAEHIDWIMEQLISYGRPLAALNVAHLVTRYSQFTCSLDCRILAKAFIELASRSQEDRDAELAQIEFGHVAIREMLEFIQNQEQLTPQEIAQIEWIYVQIFRYECLQPKYLAKEVIDNPTFFAQLISWRSNPDEGGRRDNARELLEILNRLPGQTSEGAIDVAVLKAWIREAREHLERLGQKDIGDRQIGKLLVKSPVGTDGIWPHEAIREVLEELQNPEIEAALEVGKLNVRGVTSRSPFEGGRQERVLAQQYREQAEQIQFEWPKTARILRRLAERLQWQGNREDNEAVLRE
jgi:hypothetical protein